MFQVAILKLLRGRRGGVTSDPILRADIEQTALIDRNPALVILELKNYGHPSLSFHNSRLQLNPGADFEAQVQKIFSGIKSESEINIALMIDGAPQNVWKLLGSSLEVPTDKESGNPLLGWQKGKDEDKRAIFSGTADSSGKISPKVDLSDLQFVVSYSAKYRDLTLADVATLKTQSQELYELTELAIISKDRMLAGHLLKNVGEATINRAIIESTFHESVWPKRGEEGTHRLVNDLKQIAKRSRST